MTIIWCAFQFFLFSSLYINNSLVKDEPIKNNTLHHTNNATKHKPDLDTLGGKTREKITMVDELPSNYNDFSITPVGNKDNDTLPFKAVGVAIKKLNLLKAGESFELKINDEISIPLTVKSLNETPNGYHEIRGERFINNETLEFSLALNIFGEGHGFIETLDDVYEITVLDSEISYRKLLCTERKCTSS